MICNILDFGAAGDGKTDDTRAIQQALNKCADAGGGTVLFPGGHIFRAGYLRVSSYTELHFENGSVLKAADEIDAFSPDGGRTERVVLDHPSYTNCEYNGGPTAFFLHINDAEYVSITGEGCIDGNQMAYRGRVLSQGSAHFCRKCQTSEDKRRNA